MQNVVANLEKPFALLKTTIEQNDSILPALFQSDVEQVESSLMMLSLQWRFRGISIGERDSRFPGHFFQWNTTSMLQVVPF